jgi:hypothetical protein
MMKSIFKYSTDCASINDLSDPIFGITYSSNFETHGTKSGTRDDGHYVDCPT